MKRWLVVILAVVVIGVANAQTSPVPIIFDTDMDTDCDDAGALAMLHTMADEGQAEILGTLVSSHYRYSVPCAAAINTYYGRPDLPIGCPKGPGAPTNRGSAYARQIAEAFPTQYKSNDDAPNAAMVYRQLLAAEEDDAVVIVTVGYLTNLRDLLATTPDSISPLTGLELAKRKVKCWVCMGGRYPEHLDPGVYGNFKPDPNSAVEAVNRWPGPIVFTGLGSDIITGQSLKRTPPTNPVRSVYDLYLKGKPGRPSWDLVAVLYAVRPNDPFWQLQKKGHNHLFPNGTNQWRQSPNNPRHTLLHLKPDTKPQVQSLLNTLISQPPHKRQTAN